MCLDITHVNYICTAVLQNTLYHILYQRYWIFLMPIFFNVRLQSLHERTIWISEFIILSCKNIWFWYTFIKYCYAFSDIITCEDVIFHYRTVEVHCANVCQMLKSCASAKNTDSLVLMKLLQEIIMSFERKVLRNWFFVQMSQKCYCM